MARQRCISVCGLLVIVAAILAHHSSSAPAQEEPQGRKLAFLVGIREYNHLEFKDLDFPENDVEEFDQVLKKHGFKTDVLTTAKGKKDAALAPTAENIRSRLNTLLKDVTKRDLIIVGLAGHGIQPLDSEESFFCPMDGNPVVENGRAVDTSRLISLGEILGLLRKSGIGDKLVLIDACRNDPSIRGRRGVDHVNVAALPAQTGVLLSCSQGEFSFENKSLGNGHGAFFHHVIEGLDGAAKNQEGAVTWDSLRTYVKTQVPATVQRLYGKEGGEQNPNEIGNLRGAPRVLARVGGATTRPAPTNPAPSRPEPTRPAARNDALAEKAKHLNEIGDEDGLKTLVTDWLRDEPQSAQALTYQAIVHLQDNRIDDAFDAVNKALRSDKELALAYAVRGDVYGSKYDYRMTLRDYDDAIRLAPEDSGYYGNRSWCYCNLSSWDSAIADANQAIRLDPADAGAYLARAAAKSGAAGNVGANEAGASDAREAVRLYQKRVDANDADRAALRGLAKAYGWLGEENKAIDAFNALIRKGRSKSSDFAGRGVQYSALKRYEWAIADFTKAIERDRHLGFAFTERAKCYAWLKQWDNVIRDATDAIRLNPQDAVAYYIRGLAYDESNDSQPAKADYQQALRLDPNYRQAREALEKLK